MEHIASPPLPPSFEKLALFRAHQIPKCVIGVIHLPPLPGTPFYRGTRLSDVIDAAIESACALQAGGAHGCLIQTADRVYSRFDTSDPARTVAIGLVVDAVSRATDKRFDIGVQIMRNAVRISLAVAKVAGGSFVRAGALVGTTQSPQGIVTSNPLAVMEYRHKLDAWDISIVAEIDSPVHFKWLGESKPPLTEVAKYAVQAGADAVSLGHPNAATTVTMIASVREALPDTPVIITGYTNHENARELTRFADGVFVGKCLERGGWGGPIDVDLVRRYVDALNR